MIRKEGTVKKTYLTLFAALFCMQAVAYEHELMPYVGLNAQMRYLPFKAGYGKDNFQSKMPQGEVIAGLKLNPYLGFEVGYLRSVERHRTVVTGYPVSPYLGIPNYFSSGESEKASFYSRIDGATFNMIGFLPVDDNIQLIGSLCIARMRVKLSYVPLGNQATDFPQSTIDELTRTFTKSKYIPQAKAGVQYMITQAVGFRALIGWDGTGRFKLLNNKQGTKTTFSLKDSYNVGLGLAYYFN